MTEQEMRRIIEQDPETKDLNISDADLFRVYQYIVARDQNTVIDGYRPKLIKEPYIEIVYVPTKEKQEEIRQKNIRKHLKFFDTEVYIQNATLEGFKVFNDERQKGYDLALDFILKYKKKKIEKGLYVYGQYGTGKSYLLSAIAKELALMNVTVLFVYMPDLVRTIKQGIQQGNLEQRINELKQVPILMLDDLGGENMSPWFRDEVFVPILQYRLSAHLPVFISSNFEAIKLLEAFTLDQDETSRVKAARLIQRIKDLTTYVKISESRYENTTL